MPMTLLNQVIAVEPTVKSRAEKMLTDVHRVMTKPELTAGISRKYRPRDEEGEVLPDEYKLPQTSVGEALDLAAAALTQLWDVTATKDYANTQARANVTVGETRLLTEVPVTYLLFLEKQLVNIRTFVEKLPVLDPALRWTLDPNTAVYTSETVTTQRSTKVRRNWVRAEATKEHPAQVDVFTEDETVGYWDTTRLSGAVPVLRRTELLARVDQLIVAVRQARESANTTEVVPQEVVAGVFRWLFS